MAAYQASASAAGQYWLAQASADPPLRTYQTHLATIVPYRTSSAFVRYGVLRLLGVEPKDEVASAFTGDEVAGLVAESRREGLLDEAGGRLLDDALAFAERTVESVLLPAGQLLTIAPHTSVAEVETLVNRTGYSRFPVREGPALTGYIHIKDLLDTGPDDLDRPVPADRIRPLPHLAAGIRLRPALNTLRSGSVHLAQVHDEGGLVGVVALEDILEELVGEVRDATQGRTAGRAAGGDAAR